MTELILRDLNGENIALRTLIYGHAHRELLNGWVLLYKNMYKLFGKTQIMILKIVWDWGSYWAIPTLMFMNDGYTNIDVLKRYSASSNSIGQRFSKLNQRMQELFLEWGKHDIEPCSDQRINVFDLDCLDKFHQGLSKRYRPEDLMNKIEANLKILEKISAEIFRIVSAHINGTPMSMKVDPYQMAIHQGKDELANKSEGPHALTVDDSIQEDIARVWFSPLKIISNEYT